MYDILSNKHKESYRLSFSSNIEGNNWRGTFTYCEVNDKNCTSTISEDIGTGSKEELLNKVSKKLSDRGDIFTIYPNNNYQNLVKYRSAKINFRFEKELDGGKTEKYLNGSIIYYSKCSYPYSSELSELDNLILKSIRDQLSFKYNVTVEDSIIKTSFELKELKENVPLGEIKQEPFFRVSFSKEVEDEFKIVPIEYEYFPVCIIQNFKDENAKSLMPTIVHLINLNDKQLQLWRGLMN
ncbi:MAG: hypothetical protein IM600_18335 [Bacteroidetes bacterium]|nr:hypothetical protein [Bacteroidota bacterium]MCA6445391.1 hypothetical protein [Bacteroidota bacterium]